MSEAVKYENKNPIHQYVLRKFLGKIEQAVSDANASRILEIGCADGYVIKYLKERDSALSFHGIDIDNDALENARRMNPDEYFEYGDALTPPVIVRQAIRHGHDA